MKSPWSCSRLTVRTCALHASPPSHLGTTSARYSGYEGKSADLVRLACLICDERGRVAPHGDAGEPCGQVVLLHRPPEPAVDAPAESAPATQDTTLFSPVLELRITLFYDQRGI